MLTKRQLKLFKPFQANIFKEYSYKDIAKASQEKSNNALRIALNQFIKEKIISERTVGNLKLYRVNTANELCYSYLDLLKYEDFPSTVEYSIRALKEEIEEYTMFYSLVIFGSYATGKQHKGSDLDVAILLPDKKQENNMKIAENMNKSKAIVPLHIQIISYADFMDMLTIKTENVGKEIAHKHRAVYNIPIFYKIIQGAMNNGFNY